MLYISENGLNLIKKFEGFSPVMYTCPAGMLTIGYGHVVRKGEKFTVISEAEATALLTKDCAVAVSGVNSAITVPLNQNQFDALVSFCYNLGVGTLLNSTLRKKLNARDYAGTPAQIIRYVFAAGVKLPGLVSRRDAEAKLFGTPC